jgi:hypothetical protein
MISKYYAASTFLLFAIIGVIQLLSFFLSNGIAFGSYLNAIFVGAASPTLNLRQ